MESLAIASTSLGAPKGFDRSQAGTALEASLSATAASGVMPPSSVPESSGGDPAPNDSHATTAKMLIIEAHRRTGAPYAGLDAVVHHARRGSPPAEVEVTTKVELDLESSGGVIDFKN